MLGKETIRARLDSGGISYTEFSYMLLQSMDYLELFRRYDCRLQVGGSDQWGNLTAGIDLIRRVEGASVHALSWPLVTSATGEKFGKSTGGGSLWLDPTLTSPYSFFQYWINVDDADVGRYLRFFTFLPREEIEALDRDDRRAAGGAGGRPPAGRGDHHAGPRRGRDRGGDRGECGAVRPRASSATSTPPRSAPRCARRRTSRSARRCRA